MGKEERIRNWKTKNNLLLENKFDLWTFSEKLFQWVSNLSFVS